MHRRVRAHHDTILAVPRLTLNPVCCTKKCICSTIASVEGIKAFHTVVVVSFKKRHQERLGRLSAVHGTLSTNLETPNLCEGELALSKQAEHARHCHRHRVLVVAHERDVLLAAAHRVSSRTRMEHFRVGCAQGQAWRVVAEGCDTDGLADVRYPGVHCGKEQHNVSSQMHATGHDLIIPDSSIHHQETRGLIQHRCLVDTHVLCCAPARYRINSEYIACDLLK